MAEKGQFSFDNTAKYTSLLTPNSVNLIVSIPPDVFKDDVYEKSEMVIQVFFLCLLPFSENL